MTSLPDSDRRSSALQAANEALADYPAIVAMHEEQTERAEAERDRLAGEVERLREALKDIADRTWDVQYSSIVTPSVVRFASDIHDIARAAIEPAPALDERQNDA